MAANRIRGVRELFRRGNRLLIRVIRDIRGSLLFTRLTLEKQPGFTRWETLTIGEAFRLAGC